MKLWKRIAAMVLAAAACLPCLPAAAADFGTEYLIVYRDGRLETAFFDSSAEGAAMLEALRSREEIALVQPNYIYTLDADEDASASKNRTQSGLAVNDPMYGKQWGLYNKGGLRFSGKDTECISVHGMDINIEEAWRLRNGSGRSVVVAIIDTGVDISHEDFTPESFWVNPGEIPGNGIDDDGNGFVDDIHGWNFFSDNAEICVGEEDDHATHGAGSIVAVTDNGIGTAGIAGDGSVQVMVLKALGGDTDSGPTLGVIRAIRYAEENGADICCLSCGSEDFDQALYNAIEGSDMLFFISAGNEGKNSDITPCYPAAFALDNIVSVANIQPDGKLNASSNYGRRSVDLAAPGTFIVGPATNNGYHFMTGTSMSAPICAGVAALVLSSCENLRLPELKEILLDSVQKTSTLDGKVLTGGIVDAGAAMALAMERSGAAAVTAAETDAFDEAPEPELSQETAAQNAEENSGSAEDDTERNAFSPRGEEHRESAMPASDLTLPFTDIPEEGALHDAVSLLYAWGVMQGTSETAFSPESTLTRAMTVTLLGRLTGAVPVEKDTFADVMNGSWYSGYVGWATEMGIVQGYGNGSFGTEDPVTGVQLSLMLMRCADRFGLSYRAEPAEERPLTRGETAIVLAEFAREAGL